MVRLLGLLFGVGCLFAFGMLMAEALTPSPNPYVTADQNGDGIVTAGDLGVVASQFGPVVATRVPCSRQVVVAPGQPWPDIDQPVDIYGTPVLTPQGVYLVLPTDFDPQLVAAWRQGTPQPVWGCVP
jgi:hypothetical protein